MNYDERAEGATVLCVFFVYVDCRYVLITMGARYRGITTVGFSRENEFAT